MPNLNVVHLMGNLTRDPELRVLPKGTAICSFSLAINRKWKAESGEMMEEVTYVDCEAWAKTGENISKYVTKGKPLYVSGRLRLDTWEDKNTKEKRSRMKVVVEQFQFLASGEKPLGREAPTATPPAGKTVFTPGGGAGGSKPTQADMALDDEDIKF
jgi:single-strand DNA-binding protein